MDKVEKLVERTAKESSEKIKMDLLVIYLTLMRKLKIH